MCLLTSCSGWSTCSARTQGESGPFSLDIADDGPGPVEEVVQPGQLDPDEADEAYQSDVETNGDVGQDSIQHITLTSEPPLSTLRPW